MYQTSVRRWTDDRLARSGTDTARGKITLPALMPGVVSVNTGILALLASLSSREHEIAALVARGLSNKEVALELRISPWTVSAHLRRIFTKLDIRRRIELCLLMAQS